MKSQSSRHIWEKVFNEKQWGKYPSESLVRFLFSKLLNNKEQPNLNILEIEAGQEQMGGLLQKRG